jgi:ribosomal protein L14
VLKGYVYPCIGGNKKYAGIGDTIIAVVKALPNMPVKRSDVVRAIIVELKKVFVDKMECIFDLMIMRLCL